MSDFLQDLLHEAEQMTAQIEKENAGLPRLQRTASQLFEVNKRKLAKSSTYLSGDSNEINASILLARIGIDAPKLTQTIEGLKLAPAASATASISSELSETEVDRLFNLDHLRETDLRSFLKSEKEAALMSVIEETKSRTISEIEDSFSMNDESEWEKQKQKIIQELHGSFNPELSISLTTSSLGSKSMSASQGRSVMSDVEMEFSKEVFAYNEQVILKEQPKPDLLSNLVTLSQRLNDKNIEDLWTMVSFMSKSSNYKNEYEKELSQAQLEEMPKQTNVNRDNSPQTQEHFVNQAVSYLELCFKDVIKNTVNANLKQAKIGGVIGTLALVTGYLRLPQSEKYHMSFEETFDEKQPLWPTIYLCLRCGDLDAARTVALKTKKDDLVIYLDEYMRETNGARRRLSLANENKLKLEYKSKIKRANDLYKRAVYSYLCRICEDDSIGKIFDNVDDFLWFKMNSVVFASSSAKEASPVENLTFSEFQTKLSIEYGEKYFVKNRNPFTYLQVLLLTAQLEMAIEFLLKYESLIVHGVHLAIALFERKLLNTVVSSLSSQLIVSGGANEVKCLRRINIACLIKMYTRKFECTDPIEALQYYFFLRNMPSMASNKRTTSYFCQYVSELAMETREFELLFGRLEKNSVRRLGVVDKFIGEAETETIITFVAEEIKNKGLIDEAIKMFDLCKDYQRVLELCNKQMSQVVSDVSTANSARERLKVMIISIATRYKTETNTSVRAIQKSTLSTFYLLVDLMTFFDLYHSENWELAYETLSKLSVLPKTSFNVDANVKEFIAYSEEVTLK